MQDVDRPPHIQALPKPAGTRRPRGEAKAVRIVTRPKRLDGIPRHRSRRRHLRQRAAIGPPESERSVGPARNLVPLLVHGSVMPATEEREVRERGRAAVGPVAEMMPLAETDAAAGEATAPVPMLEGPSQGGGNSPGPGPDLQQMSIVVVTHHHPARVARQAPGRFRRNARAVLEDGLPRLLRTGQDPAGAAHQGPGRFL